MKHIYLITFYLCFGVIFLGLPQVYSTSSSKNKPTEALFQYAIQAYNKYRKIENPNNYTLTPKEALGEIKNALSPPPTRGCWLVSGYIRKSFSQPPYKKDLSREITFLILRFIIVTQDSYKESTQKILDWATKDYLEAGFITDYLKETHTLRCFYDKASLSNLTSNLGNYAVDIYLYENNFLEKDLLLWLMNDLKWKIDSTKRKEQYHHKFRITKSEGLRREMNKKLCKLLILHILKGKKFKLYKTLCERVINLKYSISYKKLMGFI